MKFQLTHNGTLVSEHETMDEAGDAMEAYMEEKFGDSAPLVAAGKVNVTVNVFTGDDNTHNQISVGPCHNR